MHVSQIQRLTSGDMPLAAEWNALVDEAKRELMPREGFEKSITDRSISRLRYVWAWVTEAMPTFSLAGISGTPSQVEGKPAKFTARRLSAGGGLEAVFTNGDVAYPAGCWALLYAVGDYDVARLRVTGTLPVVGKQCGPDLDATKWGVTGTMPGFVCLNASALDTDGITVLVDVVRARPPSGMIGVTTTTVTAYNAGSSVLGSGSVRVRYRGAVDGTLADMTDPTTNLTPYVVTAYNLGPEIAAGERVKLDYVLGVGLVISSAQVANALIRFQLTAPLVPGGSAAALELMWDGAAYVTTGDPITVRDFTAGPGFWRGLAGYQGEATFKADRGDYEIVWMECKALFIRFTTTGTFSASSAPITINDFWNGNDPGAGPHTVYDDTGNSDGQVVGFKGVASYDWIDDKYRVLNTNVDEKVRSASGQSPGFLSQVVADFQGGPNYNAVQDLLITQENIGLTPNAVMRFYGDMSVVSGFSATGTLDLKMINGALTFQADTTAQDKFVALTATNNPNYLANLLAGVSSPSYNAAQDFGISWVIQGVAPDQVIFPYVDLSLVSGWSSATVQYIQHDTGGNTFWGPISTTDQLVAVSAGNTPNFLNGLLTDTAHTGVSIGIDFSVTGISPNQTIIAQSHFSTISGYNAAVDQYLRHSNGGAFYWQVGPNEDDKFVAVSITNTPNYLGFLLSDRAHSGLVLGGDFTVVGAAPNQTIDVKVDMTLLPGYNPSLEQYLIHNTGAPTWTPLPKDRLVAVSTLNTPDFLSGILTDLAHGGVVLGGDWNVIGTAPFQTMTVDVDLSLLPSYNAGLDQFLRHDASGIAYWGIGTTGPDEKVAVSSANTPNYLNALLVDLATTGVVLGIDVVINGSAPNQTITFRCDLSTITGYSATGDQLLGHNASGLKWYDPFFC